MGAAPIPDIQTERFRLRPVIREDAAALLPVFSDPDQMRYWSCGPFSSEGELADWLLDPDWNGRSWAAVRHGDDGDGDGDGDGTALARIVAIPDMPNVCEIGYIVTGDAQRQGLARECVSALLGHLFVTENHRRVWADVDPDNDASNALLQSLGFTQEARLRQQWETHIGVRDSLIWGLLADEWKAR